MQDKIHEIDGEKVVVKTEVLTAHPPSFKIRGQHESGAFHEESLTLGDADLTNIVDVDTAQQHLDAVRLKVAQLTVKKLALNQLLSKIQ